MPAKENSRYGGPERREGCAPPCQDITALGMVVYGNPQVGDGGLVARVREAGEEIRRIDDKMLDTGDLAELRHRMSEMEKITLVASQAITAIEALKRAFEDATREIYRRLSTVERTVSRHEAIFNQLKGAWVLLSFIGIGMIVLLVRSFIR